MHRDRFLADTNDKITRLCDYPLIGAEKLSMALDRLLTVHACFGDELKSIDTEVARQVRLSRDAAISCERVGPTLASIGENLESITSITRQTGRLISDGLTGLKDAVKDVEDLVARLRARTEEMHSIASIGQEVRKSVGQVAETTVENRLIAINAAVTASRAGDRVKGFKVIASEISRLSAYMEERVEQVVEQAELVGDRMQAIVSTMDESIRSTQNALESIDEAFGLLESAEASIKKTDAVNRVMLEGNSSLKLENNNIAKAVSGIEAHIDKTMGMAAAVRGDLDEQSRALARLHAEITEYMSICSEITTTADQSFPEQPKIFTTKELALQDYDPAHMRLFREVHFSFNIFLRLLRYSSDNEIVPYLAETWVLHPDGRTWEFRLMKNAVFQDGSPVTSRDVKFSLERIMNPQLGSPYSNMFSVIEGSDDHISGKVRGVSGIIMPDPHTIQIRLKSSFNFFLSLVALGFTSIVKENQAYYSRKMTREEFMSGGAFRLLNGDDEESDLLVPNKRFINGRPFLDGFEIIRDSRDTKEAFRDGTMDGSYGISFTLGKELKASGFNGTFSEYTSRNCFGLVVNYKRDSWVSRHKELFTALSMGFNKDRIVNEALDGYAEKANCVIPNRILDTGGEVFIPHEITKAKKILDEWRSKTDLDRPLKIGVRGYPALFTMTKMADAIKKNFLDLGLNVETDIVDQDARIVTYVDKYDLIFLGFMGEVDIYSAIEPFINPNGGDNYFGYNNPEMFELLMSSIVIKDNNERKKKFIEILRQLTRDGFMLPVFFQKVLSVSGTHVHGLFMSPEETYISDVIYLWPENTPTGIKTELLDGYSSSFDSLYGVAQEMVKRSKNLVFTGRDFGELLKSQQAETEKVYDLFEAFMKSTKDADSKRIEMLSLINETVFKAAKTGQARTMIKKGLEELAAAVEETCRTLSQVEDDILLMQSSVNDILSSNDFISSIAVNAAIIAAKSEHGVGDLRKVSDSIAEQAKQNFEYSNLTAGILIEMQNNAIEHENALAEIARSLRIAASQVGTGGTTLDQVEPLLKQADIHSQSTETMANTLAGAIEGARIAVNGIQEEARIMAQQTDVLKFNLDLEQGMANILGDLAGLNREIRDKVLADRGSN